MDFIGQNQKAVETVKIRIHAQMLDHPGERLRVNIPAGFGVWLVGDKIAHPLTNQNLSLRKLLVSFDAFVLPVRS